MMDVVGFWTYIYIDITVQCLCWINDVQHIGIVFMLKWKCDFVHVLVMINGNGNFFFGQICKFFKFEILLIWFLNFCTVANG